MCTNNISFVTKVWLSCDLHDKSKEGEYEDDPGQHGGCRDEVDVVLVAPWPRPPESEVEPEMKNYFYFSLIFCQAQVQVYSSPFKFNLFIPTLQGVPKKGSIGFQEISFPISIKTPNFFKQALRRGLRSCSVYREYIAPMSEVVISCHELS